MEKKQKRGFSLVELLIVMALIAVMLVIAGPRLVEQLPKWHMKGTARDVAAKFMMARLRAIQENNQYGVEFSFGDIDTYRLVKESSGSWPAAGVVGESTADIDILVEGCISNDRVVFFPNGKAISEDGTTTCPSGSEATYKKIMTVETKDGLLSTTLEVNPMTGIIRVI
jgi:prepilin-type N-terminal cleavage/methylation domain-containing protein